ncbi:MAG: hypothetical protein J6K58_07355 [Lachnospiraceae bacterium]|nr:hypothetical protein [Lachnospiraceae bacterium]
MKKKRLLLAVTCLTLLLGGCAFGEDVDTTTIIVDKKGTVVESIVEDFDKDYYNADDLEGMITKEIQDYNSTAGGEKVKLDSFELTEDGKQVKVKIQYGSADDYKQMNERELFCGTVSDAYNAGYEFVSMTDQETGAAVSQGEVLELGNKKIVISEEALDIRVSGKITHVSEGITVKDHKTAVLPDDGEKLSYVIYE